jgi:hypothetical protein
MSSSGGGGMLFETIKTSAVNHDQSFIPIRVIQCQVSSLLEVTLSDLIKFGTFCELLEKPT